MSPDNFTPGDLRKSLVGEIKPDREQAEQLLAFWRQLGMRPAAANAGVLPGPSDVTLLFLLEPVVKASDLARCWPEILADRHRPTLADLVLIEYWFSVGAAHLVRLLQARLSYSKTLLTIRQRVAIALHDYAREINWRRPVLFVAALKIARAYLRDAVGHEEALQPPLRKNFTGRLGVATVLISRFESISREDANEALRVLERSIDQGNTSESAFAYLLEAHAVFFDIEPDIQLLDRALAKADEHASQDSSLVLAHIDLLIRKSTAGGFAAPDRRALDQARMLAHACSPALAEDRVRLIMAIAIIEFLQTGSAEEVDFVHARLPFGLRIEGEPNELLVRSASYGVEPLRIMASSGEPLARGLLADYLLVAAGSLGVTEEAALAESVSLRGGERSLEDERSRLLNCRDQLRLAFVKQDTSIRIDALLQLARMLDSPHVPAAPLVLLARDVQEHGGQPVPVDAGTSSYVEEVLRNVSQGQSAALYEKAGEAALVSPDLSVLALGGRSGVTSVADYYGLSSETFVFKNMTQVAIEQERRRAEALAEYLRTHALNERFGVSRLLATYAGELNRETEVTAARHFVRGRSLYDAVGDSEDDRRSSLLVEAAVFLGVINDCESGPALNEGRREIKTKELGRWLKSCGLDDANAIYERWWELVKGAELVRRRDAHLHNWLLAEDSALYAIDLEAQGWRPAGYELAQLTDDHPFLAANDWHSRRVIFDAYRDARRVDSESESTEWVAYQASVLARMVWGLTGSADGPFASGVGERRLADFIDSVPEERLSILASEILKGWLALRGLTSLPLDNPAARGAGRVRKSKSMAFHLRHDVSLERDEGGWALLEDLQQKLKPRLPVEVLAAVATDKTERRFEIRAGKIRARYGHSIHVEMDYVKPKDPLRLYHASPWALASEIVDARSGIRPMNRQFVHLNDIVEEAVANGMRAGQPLLYSVSSVDVPAVLRAHGRTYLSGSIPMKNLSIVPVSCFWSQVPPCI